MEVHAGVDAATGYVHTLTGTAANVHDVSETSKLIRNDEHIVYGDSGYPGATGRKEIKNDEELSGIAKSMQRFNLLFASANRIMCYSINMKNRIRYAFFKSLFTKRNTQPKANPRAALIIPVVKSL